MAHVSRNNQALKAHTWGFAPTRMLPLMSSLQNTMESSTLFVFRSSMLRPKLWADRTCLGISFGNLEIDKEASRRS